jgi:anti-sigma-K factor RskA
MSDVPADAEPAEDDDVLAAEYVLGVLNAGARRRLERRRRHDPAMQRRVEEWENRLAPMLAAVEPVQPPPSVWPRTERDLDRLLRFRAAALAAAPAEPAAGLVSPIWKWFGIGSFGLLAASLALLFVSTQPRVGEAPLAAVIAPAGGAVLYAAVIDERSNRATLIPIAVHAVDGRAHELWAIAPNAQPRSLGVLPESGPVQIRLSPRLVADGYTLAISEEPAGGSPTGQPTGPVLGTGALGRI